MTKEPLFRVILVSALQSTISFPAFTVTSWLTVTVTCFTTALQLLPAKEATAVNTTVSEFCPSAKAYSGLLISSSINLPEPLCVQFMLVKFPVAFN